ncbi:hypothetical protein J6590_104260 [Homalodisca vitripennis]|nr:hypothetical protein J6590_104260 [Homalodisca vitripennis]
MTKRAASGDSEKGFIALFCEHRPDAEWRGAGGVFGEKVTAHGSACTNAATPRHQSPHCSLPLHTLPIRKLYLFDYTPALFRKPCLKILKSFGAM